MYRVLFFLWCALLLSGCKTEKLREPAALGDEKSHVGFFLIDGKVNVGVVANSVVSVHPLSNGQVDFQTIAGAVSTDSNGEFTVLIDNRYKGIPAVIRATTSSDLSFVTCVLPGGCPNNVPFAKESNGENFDLYLVVSSLHDDRRYNVSLFSHAVYESLVLAGTFNDMAQTQYLIESLSARVSSRFEIVGDLPSLCGLDITRTDEVTHANSIDLRCSILSSAAMQVMRKLYPAKSFSDLIAAFSNEFLNGIPGKSSSVNAVSYAEILNEAIKVSEFLQVHHEIDLSKLLSELSVARGLVLSEVEDEFPKDDGSNTSGLTPIEKGKSFVSDVRRVASSLDLHKFAALGNLSQFVNGGVTEFLGQFGVSLDALGALQGEQMDRVSGVLQKAVVASFLGMLDFYADKPVPTSYEGLNYTYINSGTKHLFVFSEPIGACEKAGENCWVEPNLRIILDAKRFSANVGSQFVTAESFGVLLIGSVRSGDLTVEFLGDKEQITVKEPALMLEEKREDGWGVSSYIFESESVQLNMPVWIKRERPQASTSVGATISMRADKLSFDYLDRMMSMLEENAAILKLQEQDILLKDIKGFQLDFGASVADVENGNSYIAGNLRQGAGQVPEELIIKMRAADRCDSEAENAECEELSSDTFIEGESPEAFLKLTGSIGFNANLKGMSAPVIVEILGFRDSPTANTISNLKVSQPGRAVNINAVFNNNGGISYLDATNLDGMHLYFDMVGGKRKGALESSESEKVADVIDMGQWVKVRYLNGDFESL